VVRIGPKTDAYKNLVENPERKSHYENRIKMESNIKMNLKEII
jgi:hypothetical protein